MQKNIQVKPTKTLEDGNRVRLIKMQKKPPKVLIRNPIKANNDPEERKVARVKERELLDISTLSQGLSIGRPYQGLQRMWYSR